MLVTGSFFLVRQTFDIKIFDTFYVVPLQYLYWFLAGLLTVSGLFYNFAKVNYYATSLIGLHLTLSMLVCIVIIVFHISNGQMYLFTKDLDLYNVLLYQKNNLKLTLLLMALGVVQGIFAYNFIRGMFKSNKRTEGISSLRKQG